MRESRERRCSSEEETMRGWRSERGKDKEQGLERRESDDLTEMTKLRSDLCHSCSLLKIALHNMIS